MKVKRLLLILCLVIFLVTLWFNQNHTYLGKNSIETLLYMNNSAFGYSSIFAYTLFYIVPFLMLLSNFFYPENLYNLIRAVKRQNYYKFKVIEIGSVSLLFSSIHTIINITCTHIFFSINLLEETHFLLISLLNMVSLVFFYISVGIMFRLTYDLCNSMALAIFIVYFILASLYFGVKLLLPNGNWDPFEDLTIFTNMLNRDWSTLNLIIVYIRQVIIVFIFYLVGSSTFLNKDYKK
ncbi:WxPxxD family membrane protein [Bacillus subtilis]|uniref:WxPxxD family membrane protein n=1 Tax=Bacillus subtilis TaxID=1423 RepID=UPI001560AE94|nr:WxPxxD family membrane protein [Bacillus subtilis]NRG38542.1 WxPxxD family membrane protein [Bacillus subtilis]